MIRSEEQIKKDIRLFLAVVIFLTSLGLIFVYSSSSVYALEKFGSSHYFLKKQSIYCLLALGAFFVCALFPIRFFRRMAPFLYLVSLCLTVLTMIPRFALRVHGANRWLAFGGMSFQPSELLKLALFLYVGYFLARKQDRIKSFVHSYLPFGLILGITFIVLLKQPDFGSVVTIFSTCVMLFFIAEFNMKYLLIVLGASVPAIAALVLAKSYRLNRILVFLNPWSDPQGRGFQIIQSLIAIGSGHVWGLGISNSRQKFFYLPMQHTDFIFPIIAEEVGFVGATLVVCLFLALCYYGLRVAVQLKDPFAFFMSLGFVIFISLQALINLMVTVGLLPTKGLGLPFVSYGGTALIVCFCMVGLIVNVVRHQIRNSRSY